MSGNLKNERRSGLPGEASGSQGSVVVSSLKEVRTAANGEKLLRVL